MYVGSELVANMSHEELVLGLAEIPAVAMIERKQDCETFPEDTQTETSRTAKYLVKYWSEMKKRRCRHGFHPLGDVLGSDNW